ncbi:MAG: hypothetical protein ABIO60_03205 [Aquaticitalea sp.]
MKKLCIAFTTVLALVIASCTGDQGPPGSPGIDGGQIVSQAFEINVNFTAANNFEQVESYGFQVLPTDVTLVYILWDTVNGQDIWRLLPQTVEFNDGLLIYNFDFTQTDVRFFLDGTTNFNTLDASYTQAQVFRVVVVPADNVGRVDVNDLDSVMNVYGIQTFDEHYL